MSKRSSQRNRHQQRAEIENERAFDREVLASIPQGNGHAAVLTPPPPTTEREAVQRVGEIMERAKATATESKQPRFNNKNPSSIFSSLYRWASTLQEPASNADARAWDNWYRNLVTEPGAEPHIAGTFASIVGIDKNRHYTVTGGRNQVNRVLQTIQGADDGRGWRQYVTWQSTSFWATRMGFVTELGREGDGGPVRALWSVDPTRVELTNNPESPLKYYPQSGTAQEWYAEDYFRGASMGSTNEARNGLGFPFVARAVDLTKIMLAVWEHDKEQLGARAPRGLLLLKGIDQAQWETAMTARAETLDAMERQYYGGVAVLAGMGPDDLSAQLVALSQLPAGFDLQQWVSLYMYGLALCAGYDPREFYPVSAGALGTATETETQHRKASSKGDLDFSLAHQEQLQNQLPPTILFEYEQRDVQGEVDDVSLQQAKANLITTMAAWQAEGASVLTAQEIRQLAAQHGVIPQEWTVEEENVTGDDTFPEVDETLANERVMRAVMRYPDEPIVRYSSRGNRSRVLWERGEDATRRRSYPVVKVVEARTDDALPVPFPRREMWRLRKEQEPMPTSFDETNRSVEGAVSRFRRDLISTITNFFNGGELQVGGIREIVSKGIYNAYTEALKEAGIAEDEIEADEFSAIDALTQEQISFVGDFVKAIRAAKGDTDKEGAIRARAELWTGSIAAAGEAGLNSAKANEMVEFRLVGDPSDESCDTCGGLLGKRHRRKWVVANGYEVKPGNENFACGNWNCPHGWVAVS